MRLWTLHPKYLDPKGLVALWREALLAQAVLRGETRGYTSHPQLIRFKETAAPLAAIAAYLQEVQREAARRGYAFDARKINASAGAEAIPAASGQLEYEWHHLQGKLQIRAPGWLAQFTSISFPDAHPLFRIVPGAVAAWEHVRTG
jgi:hypothetical protein